MVITMALVLVIEASGLTVPGWVVWSGGLGSQLLVPEERVPEPEVVVAQSWLAACLTERKQSL